MSRCVFFSSFVAIENIDITQILSLQDGEAVYPLPRIRSLAVHPKLNLAALLFSVKHARIYKLLWSWYIVNVLGAKKLLCHFELKAGYGRWRKCEK